MSESSENIPADPVLHDTIPVSGLYENWFLDYASYVILERAVPAIEDGLKPVQRRILHALNEMDDGRFNKVANVIGSTMQYHPHGDASINDAIVNLGQKELLFDTQGNWGDVRTGDGAAAPRYIEVRLSKFAKEVVYNDQTTQWQLSYDGRKREPLTLPIKFPLLLAMGVEGIAVGLSTKILPHNFCELLQASIDLLRGKAVSLYPDFLTGGLVDITNYNDGRRGGKVRVRARIEEEDKKMLLIKDIPYGTTTTSVIDSIIKANDSGKIKIKRVVDNTAAEVEIAVYLAPGVSPDITIDALYAFTDCEVSISPNACVIIDDKPHFWGIEDILRYNTEQTVDFLNKELEIRKGELLEKILYGSLEKIFIENRIYRDIEECETFEAVLTTIDRGLDPFKAQFYRAITQEDILSLTEIRIKRISKYDGFKADEQMRKWQEELDQVNHHLNNLIQYAIDYFKDLLKKYGKGRERKTEIRAFNQISATVVAANNQKLYVNRADGFIGFNLKKDEFVMDCSDLDDIIVFRKDGTCLVTKIQEKVFVGKDIIHCAVFKKNDERMVYNMVYLDGKSGISYVKRFQVTGVTRDKEYVLTQGTPRSKVLYFTANENGEAELITINLTAQCSAKVKQFEYNFASQAIKNRSANGNILTKFPVRKIALKQAGKSTLGGVELWYNDTLGRLNRDERGIYLGEFQADDLIVSITKDGCYELTNFDLTNHYDPAQVLLLCKFEAQKPLTAVYYEGSQKVYYIKRFLIETTTMDKKFLFIPDSKGSKLLSVSRETRPRLLLTTKASPKEAGRTTELIAEEVVDIRGWKALGNRLTADKVLEFQWLAPLPEAEEPEPAEAKDADTAPEPTPSQKETTEETPLEKGESGTATPSQLDLFGL